MKAETRYADWNDQTRYFEAAELLRQVITEHKKKQKEQLQLQLRDAELQHDDELARQLLNQISNLNKEINSGKR